jgi:hypothetical protein
MEYIAKNSNIAMYCNIFLFIAQPTAKAMGGNQYLLNRLGGIWDFA